MKKYVKQIITALVCFLFVVALDFFLPRLLPGDPVAYLTGFEEDEISEAQYDYYYSALHLGDSTAAQFGYYIKSLFDGTQGYSYKNDCTVSSLITERLPYSLQITLPATIISLLLGLIWGLNCGCKRSGAADKASGTFMIILNAVPSFAIALVLVIVLCFNLRLFPYMGLSSPDVTRGGAEFFIDRVYHLVLPILTVVLSSLPSRFMLVRNVAARFVDDKSVLYARERGLSERKIKFGYVFKNVAQPYIAAAGVSLGACIGGSVVVENVFSINGVGSLLLSAVYTLDYPLMQGVLFVTVSAIIAAVIISDIVCILIDPRVRKGGKNE